MRYIIYKMHILYNNVRCERALREREAHAVILSLRTVILPL